MGKVELLAPSGDIERLKIACLYGADAIYFGGQDYSLRANALNFSLDDVKEATEFAHKLGKRVHVTVNIVFHDKDLKGVKEYIKKLDEIGVDALIVSDVVVMQMMKDLGLKAELHVSTQASTLNYETVKFYQSLGAKRVVMARESSKENIEKIKKETGVDIECFIHGAMCTSFSGRCVLSNYATNRDSNRGGCAQVCRFIFDADNSDQIFSMTPKDLNMVSNIKEMIDIGVNSFKVEGRMRSIYYVATVMNVYRNLIDKVMDGTINEAYTKYYLSILNRCANRDSTEQFFHGLPGKDEQYFLGRDEVSNKDFLGFVKEYDEDTHMLTLEQRNYFKPGDVVEFFGPNLEPTTFVIPEELYNEKDEKIEAANHPQMTVKFTVNMSLKSFDMMRIKMFDISDFM
jgi:putative protease